MQMEWLRKNIIPLLAVLITLGGVYVTNKVEVGQMDQRLRQLETLSSDTEEFRRKIVILEQQQALLRGEYERQRPEIADLNKNIYELNALLSRFTADVTHFQESLKAVKKSHYAVAEQVAELRRDRVK